VSPRALIMQGFRRFVSTTMVQPSKNSSQLIGRANDEQKDEATHREKFPTLQLQPLDRTRVSIRLEWIASQTSGDTNTTCYNTTFTPKASQRLNRVDRRRTTRKHLQRPRPRSYTSTNFKPDTSQHRL
jgi:hypothetical protein